jgi:hypothetical protein
VEFLGGATGTLAGFSEDKGDNRPDFTGLGVNILFTRMRVGEGVKIVYGAGGGNSGATAPSTTGLSFFDVFVAPSFSTAEPIGNADSLAGTAKFTDSKKPFVSIQSADGSGTVQIQIKGKSERLLGVGMLRKSVRGLAPKAGNRSTHKRRNGRDLGLLNRRSNG